MERYPTLTPKGEKDTLFQEKRVSVSDDDLKFLTVNKTVDK